MKSISLLLSIFIFLNLFTCSPKTISNAVPTSMVGDWKRYMDDKPLYWRIHADGKYASHNNFRYIIKNDTLTYAHVSYWRVTGTKGVEGSWATFDPTNNIDSVFFNPGGIFRFSSTDGRPPSSGYYKVNNDIINLIENFGELKCKGDSMYFRGPGAYKNRGTFKLSHDTLFWNLTNGTIVHTRFTGSVPPTAP